MQCRWAGCTEPRGKADSKYCAVHRKAFTTQSHNLMAMMFRSSRPLNPEVTAKERHIPSKRGSTVSTASNESRDRMEKEQQEINAELDRKCGYGNGPVHLMSPKEVEELVPYITPINLTSKGSSRGKCKRSWTYSAARTVKRNEGEDYEKQAD